MAATDVTPDDLGVRSTLLVDKHAEYIRSFTRLWEVRTMTGAAKQCNAMHGCRLQIYVGCMGTSAAQSP